MKNTYFKLAIILLIILFIFLGYTLKNQIENYTPDLPSEEDVTFTEALTNLFDGIKESLEAASNETENTESTSTEEIPFEEAETSNTTNSSNSKTNESEKNNTETTNTNNFIKATVKRVVDGDTIIATIDGKDYRVRFIGINTPESTTKIEEFGKEASNYTTKMLTGKTVYLEKDVSETDKYDRLLRYVWLEIPTTLTESEIKEKMFNSILVLNGYANAATYPPDVKYSYYFNNFESIARNNNVGLWNK